jgi:hypothetical protein
MVFLTSVILFPLLEMPRNKVLHFRHSNNKGWGGINRLLSVQSVAVQPGLREKSASVTSLCIGGIFKYYLVTQSFKSFGAPVF